MHHAEEWAVWMCDQGSGELCGAHEVRLERQLKVGPGGLLESCGSVCAFLVAQSSIFGFHRMNILRFTSQDRFVAG